MAGQKNEEPITLIFLPTYFFAVQLILEKRWQNPPCRFQSNRDGDDVGVEIES